MIIRRKHTSNFTPLANTPFNDERLAADELGVLAYLLTRPNDWEVRPVQLRKRFGMGRDSMRRAIRANIRFGYMVARVTRLSNGTVSVIYEVRDEPGPELTEDEARAALSLVSSGAGPGEVSADDGPEDGTEATGEHPPPDSDPGGGQPYTGQPGAASRLLETRPGPIRESVKTDSVTTESPIGARAFSEVVALWPKDHVASAFACEKLHAELSEDLQQRAFNGLRPYLDDCRAQQRKVCDLATYYRERRWERFQQIKPNAEIALIKPGSAEFYRWREYRQATGDADGLRVMDVMAKLQRDVTVPSRWPPAIPQGRPPPISEADAKDFTQS